MSISPRVAIDDAQALPLPQRSGSMERGGAGVRRWAINGDFVTLRSTGVARYAREVTRALDALVAAQHPLVRGVELTLICPKPPAEAFDHLALKVVPEFQRPRLPQAWVQLQLPRHVRGGLVSFCNLAPVAVRHQIVCIHDLQTRLAPESYGRLFRLAHRLILPALGRRAAGITTVSNMSRDQLIRFGVAPAEKIRVTYNGSDHALRWRAERTVFDFAPKRPFVLCLGRTEAHKNLDLLLRLAAPLDALGVDLAMAGDVGPEILQRIDGAGNIRLLGRIEDDVFAAALSQALCFLLPSRMEGFGLPAVEAMARGCPVIASSAPCLPEVCAHAALYADPDDTGAWIAAVARLMSSPGLRRDLIAAGHTRARAFTWRGIALIYLSLMAELDGLSQGADQPEFQAVQP
ncbi:glycosyltransferase family 1 protein [Aquabacter sp. CN5-332]|uniref:glycosyltransferase family 4 protein n=1 Tax=Aquabacter sp. CN5-332 TaxID=3156608 RepID=UPI0032B5078F